MCDSHLARSTADLSAPVNSTSCNATLNMRIIQSLVWFVQDRFPEETQRMGFEAGVPMEKLRNCKGWISLEKVELIMSFVRSLLNSDREFMEACTYRMRESYGSLRFLLWASTPDQMLAMGQKHFSTVSTFSRGDFIRKSEGRYILRYYSNREESRLMCLSRQAQSEKLPRLWNLPEARLKETACICRGDDHCEYELAVYQKSRFLPVLAGCLAGTLVAAAAFYADLIPLISQGFFLASTPLIGGCAGYLYELRRAGRSNLKLAEEINSGLSKVVVESQEAQREIMLLNQRRRDWNKRLEEQVAQKTASTEKVNSRLRSMLEEHTTTLKGVSHDMKNPLTVVLQTAELIGEELDEENSWMVDEQKRAVKKIRVLLDDMLQMKTEDDNDLQFLPERVDTRPLADGLRRRLRALAGDAGIRISVVTTRETPQTILIDRMVMDRVLDNLISNAVKYTDRGSIVLELGGKPGFLTIKISDTGRGITAEEMPLIFNPGGSDPEKRRNYSHGLGLSVVVRLLKKTGGNLEVMSMPDKGTTFWVHFPVEPPGTGSEISDENELERVVSIRKVK